MCLNVIADTHRALKDKDSTFPHTEYSSVLRTLAYLSEHYYESSSPALSTVAFKGAFNLTTKQYAWVSLRALAKTQKWPQIESLLLTKVRSYHIIFYDCIDSLL